MWFEIIAGQSQRPGHPEDNTILIKAKHMKEAIEKFEELCDKGKLTSKFITRHATECREVFYVYE